MFYSELKRLLKLVKSNLTQEEIYEKKKELIEEFASSDSFNIPESTITIESKPDKQFITYTTIVNNIKIETIFIESNKEVLVSYKINESLFKEKSFTTSDTINIFKVVVVNFLDYIKNKDCDYEIVFETTNEAIAKIDIMLLNLCKDFLPFLKFKRRDTNERLRTSTGGSTGID